MFEICWKYCIIDEYLKFIHKNLHSKDAAIVHTCPSESTCHDVRHGVQSKWPQGSILISLSFSAHILHNWNVLPTNPIKFNTEKHRKKEIMHFKELLKFKNVDREKEKWRIFYPFHSRVHIVLESRLCDPPWDFVRQMIGPDWMTCHPDIDKIPLYRFCHINTCSTLQNKRRKHTHRKNTWPN